MAKLLDKIITVFFPDRCLLCGRVVSPGVLCCTECKKQLPFQPEGRVKTEKDEPFALVAVPFVYRDGIRNAVLQMKFYGHKEAADFFLPYMLDSLKGYTPDLVVPVPMAEHRRKERGYNQAELLAQPIARALGAEYSPHMLQRTGSIVQHDLSARLRRLEATQSFALSGKGDAAGKRVLLVDDIFTTGSTLRRCALLLKEAGAAEVVCTAAALTPRKN
jgi:ComF family protein